MKADNSKPLRIFRLSWCALSWVRTRGVANDWKRTALKMELAGWSCTVGVTPR